MQINHIVVLVVIPFPIVLTFMVEHDGGLCITALLVQ